MVEFRTRAIGNPEGESKSSDPIDKAINQVVSELKSDKEKQLKILQALQENYGIDPQLVGMFMEGVDGEGLEQAQTPQPQPQEIPEQANQEPMPEPETKVKEVTVKPEPDELLDFVDEIIEYTGEETTLKELRDWGENNPDILETAINMKF
jgi:hypothetical protein